MSQDNINNQYDDAVDLKEILQILFNKKILIGFLTLFFAVVSVFAAISMSDVYKSSSLLAPTSQDESLSSSLGGLSSLAGIAGVSLPAGSISDSQIAVKRIESFEFFSKNFLPSIKLEDLMAEKKWIPQENKLIYDKDIFDESSNKWVRKVSYPKKTIPSSQEAFKEFKKALSINQDEETGLVYLSIEHISPHVAKEWMDVIIYNINECMREIDKEDAQNSINFLSESIKTTNSQSIKLVFSKLMESQMQTLMLASSNEDYIFKTINSPIVPEEKSGPNRAFICIVGTLFGFIFSIILVLIQHFRKAVKV
tara:strand:+ start:10874 stop:11803 length:930 start_codon:yes stop_codon:yes gene_type:complete